MKPIKSQAGVSLVEVLVAVAISGILLAGVVQIFISTRQTYQTMDAASRLQEDGRFALHFLAQDLRQTGYYGCNGRQLNTSNLIPDALDAERFYFSDLNQPITGFEPDPNSDGWVPDPESATSTFGTGFSDLAVDVAASEPNFESDILAVRIPSPQSPFFQTYSLSSNVSSGDSTFTVNGVDDCNDIGSNMALVLADCQGASIVRVAPNPAAVSCSGGTANVNDLGGLAIDRVFDTALTEVYVMATRVYYVGLSESIDINGNRTIPALYRIDPYSPERVQELITGVERMDAQYGIDNGDDGFANRYVDAATANTDDLWNRVVAVRLTLILRSIEPVGAPGDGFMRREFNTTVVLRNRIPVD